MARLHEPLSDMMRRGVLFDSFHFDHDIIARAASKKKGGEHHVPLLHPLSIQWIVLRLASLRREQESFNQFIMVAFLQIAVIQVGSIINAILLP